MGEQFLKLDAKLSRIYWPAAGVFHRVRGAERAGQHLAARDEAFAILDDKTVVYLDRTGSGNETAAHLKADGRLTLMFCAFEGPAKILRLYGRGEVLRRGNRGYTTNSSTSAFARSEPTGARQIDPASHRPCEDLLRLGNAGLRLPRRAAPRSTIGRAFQGRGGPRGLPAREERRQHRRPSDRTSGESSPSAAVVFGWLAPLGGVSFRRSGAQARRIRNLGPSQCSTCPHPRCRRRDYVTVKRAIEFISQALSRSAFGRGDRGACRPFGLALPARLQALGGADAESVPAGDHHRAGAGAIALLGERARRGL